MLNPIYPPRCRPKLIIEPAGLGYFQNSEKLLGPAGYPERKMFWITRDFRLLPLAQMKYLKCRCRNAMKPQVFRFTGTDQTIRQYENSLTKRTHYWKMSFIQQSRSVQIFIHPGYGLIVLPQQTR